MISPRAVLAHLLLLACALELAAAPERVKVRLQTDWFPQAEHGGFYQALAKGYYRDAGLEVELLPGGPGAHVKPKVVAGDAEFGMNPATDLLIASSRGLPVLMVAPFLQHDHQALLLHDEDPVRGFADLGGRSITASPALAWINFLQRRFKLHFSVQPVPYGMASFFADPQSIRQCVITNEPYLARQQGVRIRLLRLADAGYDPYHVIFCTPAYARAQPSVVRAFVAASLRGWLDYIEGDPAPAHAMILDRNRQMTRGLLEFSRGELILQRLVSGDPARGEGVGHFSLARVAELSDLLVSLGLIEAARPLRSVASSDFLPRSLP